MGFDQIVSLSYDGGSISHRETVLPQLDQRGLKATFYVDPVSLMENVGVWRQAALSGHEIGNGCLLAECLPDGSFPAWTSEMILDEVLSSNELIEDLIEQESFTVAVPLGERTCADHSDYLSALLPHVIVRTRDLGVNSCSVPSSALSSVSQSGLNSAQMIAATESSLTHGSWYIAAFDEVGSGEKSVDAQAHAEFIDWLAIHQSVREVFPIRDGLKLSADQPFRVL